MSRFRSFLSNWTVFDQLAAAYSQPVFERVMLKWNLARRGTTATAILGAGLAIALALGACALVGTVAKQHYLQNHGSEASATATLRSFHTTTDRRGTPTRWQTLEYRFATRSGETISAKVSRPVAEFPPAARMQAFAVMYWASLPAINEPKGMRADAGLMLVLSALLALTVVHLALLVRRMWRWRDVVGEHRGRTALPPVRTW